MIQNHRERFRNPKLQRLALLLAGLGVVALVGCGSASDESPAAGSTSTIASEKSPQDSQTPQTTAGTAVDNTATALVGCESKVADDVPVFYSTFFRCTDISLAGDFVVISGTGDSAASFLLLRPRQQPIRAV